MLGVQNRRQSLKRLRVALRAGGLCAEEERAQNKRIRQAGMLMLIADEAYNNGYQGMSEDLELAAMIRIYQYQRTSQPIPLDIRPIERTNLRVENVNDDDAWTKFRFRKHHLHDLMRAWRVPHSITLSNGSFYDGEEAFLHMLHRFRVFYREIYSKA